MTDAITKRFGVSRYQAGWLVHTETTYFSAVSCKEAYKYLHVEEVEIVETLDGHTCSMCADMDGKIIPIAQYEPGVTVPPFHPNCRGTTCPHIDDADGERIARGADGKTYTVPANMTYREWEKKFVLSHSEWNAIINTETSDRHVVAALKDHFLDQAGAREVTPNEAIDALANTLHRTEVKYNARGKPSLQYIGKDATVAYNPDTDTVITTWRTGERLRKKYGGGKK